MIEIQNCSYEYTNKKQILYSLNLTIPKGSFFGLLGINGAGKTTLINLINTTLKQQVGQISIGGISQTYNSQEYKHSLGWVPQEYNFNNFQTLEYMLLNCAGYFGISRCQANSRIRFLLESLDLWHRKDDKIYQLSGGLKRRLMIARALLHKPKVLLLDEPTVGVDIKMREAMWDFLKDINKREGVTILLTSHYLDEVEKLCSDVALLHKGKIIKQGTLDMLLKDIKQELTCIQISGSLPDAIVVNGLHEYCSESGIITLNVDKTNNLSKGIQQILDQGFIISRIWTKQARLNQLLKEWTNQ